MNRRELLHRTSALATVAGLAGCLGSATGGSSPSGDTGTTHRTTATAGTTSAKRTGTESASATETASEADSTGTTREGESSFAGVQSDDDSAFRTVELGRRENVRFAENNRSRGLFVWNAVDSARTIRLSVARRGETLFDERIEFDADAYLAVALNEPADYRVSLAVSASETTGSSSAASSTFRVERQSFDCNSATAHVGVLEGGDVETQTVSTTMACPGPEIADTGFRAGEGECGRSHSSTITYGSHDRVHVTGKVRTPTPRTPIALADASYDAEADALTVRVETEESESDSSEGVGTQCVGEVPYQANVTFENDFPGRVVVVHESGGKSVEVATKSLGE